MNQQDWIKIIIYMFYSMFLMLRETFFSYDSSDAVLD